MMCYPIESEHPKRERAEFETFLERLMGRFGAKRFFVRSAQSFRSLRIWTLETSGNPTPI